MFRPRALPLPQPLMLALALAPSGCKTTEGEIILDVVDVRLPAWVNAPADVVRAPELEEAAALLCARDTDAVVDDEARHASRLVDGQLVGLLKKGADAEAALARDAAPLLVEKRATHAGVVTGRSPTGEPCAALVGARRLVVVDTTPAAALPSGGALALAVRVPAEKKAALYVLKPDGFVDKRELPFVADGAAQQIGVPAAAGDGRYVVELIVDERDGPSDPEVALLWPFVAGAPRDPPFPEVLFPDEGHDDVALTHRAEALVQRLRNEQLIDTLKLSPVLVDVAGARAQGIALRGALGHVLAETNAMQDIRAKYADDERARFLRLAEVQAQGSTLADAWQAMLDSPAHRHELVDTAFTHSGVAVARGKDAAGRATVTLIALLARKPPSRDVDQVRARIIDVANEARDKRGLHALIESAHLNRIATRLAGAMRDNKRVDDTLLGGPVAKVALEADATLSKVKPLVARTDDPMLLLANGAPSLLLDIDAAQAGVGIALEPNEGAFYVVLLAGE